MQKPRVLCVIPARGGSKRIKGKNARPFFGKPLIAHAIAQGRSLSFVDRVVVDTDSPDIAALARKYNAEVPFMRPAKLAGDKAQVADSVRYLLGRLAKADYKPDYVLVLQTTSPLREPLDIEACWKKMREGGATSVVMVCPAHPQLYHLGRKGELALANKHKARTSNTQGWEAGYALNGSFAYLVETRALLRERRLITKKTVAVVAPRWRSVDLDTPEDWVMAELLFRNKKRIEKAIRNFK